MPGFVQFQTKHYNTLSGFEEARLQAGLLQSVIDEVGSALVGHGLADLLGVALLHRHHTLAEGERLIWSESAKLGRKGRPQRSCREETVPCLWQWSLDDKALRPLEFVTATSSQAMLAAEELAAPAFLGHIATALDAADAAHFIGIGVLPERRPDYVLHEDNDDNLRISVRSWVRSKEANQGENTVTLWYFGSAPRAALTCGVCRPPKPGEPLEPQDDIEQSGNAGFKKPSVICSVCH